MVDMIDVMAGGFAGFFVGFMLFIILLLIVVYIYCALVLMTIAKKTKTKDAWLAWIPIANVYLMTQIANVSGWWTLGILFVFVPFIGKLALVALMACLWWKIAEARKRPGWWGIVIAIVPLVNLVLMGFLAWDDKKK